MENDKFTATASNMKNDDVEKASASNIDENTNKANKKMVWTNDEGYYEIDNEDWEIRNICIDLEGLKESPPHKDQADECCIYRVPNSLRVSNPEAYTPQLISIEAVSATKFAEAATSATNLQRSLCKFVAEAVASKRPLQDFCRGR
ncbi:hypothetical protein OIU77_003021 [Salix suchowensis]|uniref:Uncharacterized protein n=1 Tax=Salix suchowensis TaxID=1278906 RepID=A0ABQ9AZF7_9ROSI|nr:hypothetical protein OIU77_003021 [Salix suchowensis]